MGFWDKVKAVKNMVTGGGAKVYVEVVEPSLEEPFIVKVKAVVGDADVKIDKVYLKIRGLESTTVRNVEVARQNGDMIDVDHRDVSGSEVTYNIDINVSGPEQLRANGEYEWEKEVQLPTNALSTYNGINAEHQWQMFAALDAFGNDPDSGWVSFEVY